MDAMPKWADVVLVPVVSLLLAAIISIIVFVAVGQDPWEALKLMSYGAVGTSDNLGYTLFYMTNFIFTGLAVAVAFHAALFNIGGEGQVLLGGLGATLAVLFVPWPHWTLALLAGSVAAALFGALWVAIPAYLQARRGSHIVITTIMFNFMASGLLIFMLAGPLKPVGEMQIATAVFPETVHLPSLHDIAQLFGLDTFGRSPVNISIFLALGACVGVWALIWHTRLGYQIRAFGQSESAARYAGISAVNITMIALLISGALAGMMAVNNTMGINNPQLVDNAAGGAGFIGIAVALMGRNHPVGIVIAALLFGALFQGGAELSAATQIPVQIVVVIQALVIMFTGALDEMVRSPIQKMFLRYGNKGVGAPAAVLPEGEE
ncbi:ABC transporter permease [Thalassorhabdomicrobium marinisediminis]|uniref:Sugar ABC transporter permease n=1 Tax=Thalassorhabdomicrobium marinisediminis TaxID=2170577 RepID=A0A2T7FYD8_9RHOB|nr:ABC transporter permease [Thalassorhabdomicrobium marinisediminis]PVA07180.1 sugar ABC transporter permease [Thalassorhabdomicrobium marinisediminis]